MNPESEGRDEAPGATRTRRGFLRDLTVGSVAAAAAVAALTPAAEASTSSHLGAVKVFRLRTRDTVSCKACQKHHRYTIFRTRQDARENRAHPGCDCPIEPQWIVRKKFRALFKPVGLPQRQVVDLRKI